MAGFSNSITLAFFLLASVTALEPRITPAPAPHVQRQAADVVGWYASTVIGGTTICMLERRSQSGTPHY